VLTGWPGASHEKGAHEMKRYRLAMLGSVLAAGLLIAPAAAQASTSAHLAGQAAATQAGAAAPGSATGVAHSLVPARPSWEICTARGSSSLCLNRQGGGTRAGTGVIGWSAGDNNNDFIFVSISNMCANGRVSRALECPFSHDALNHRFDGDNIVKIVANGTNNLCVGDTARASGNAALEPCPDNNGNGGIGTIFTLSQFVYPSYVVNRYWSNYTGTGGGGGTNPRWMCSVVRGFPVSINSTTGSAGYCQWNEFPG
jgi:hypothetical protein